VVAKLVNFFAETLQGIVRDAPQGFQALWLLLDDVQGFASRCRCRRRTACAEDICAYRMAKPIDDGAVGCNEATDGSEALGESSHDEVNFIRKAEVVADASALLAEHADAVRFVNHDSCIVFLLQLDNLGQLAEVAFHAEHTIYDNQLDTLGLTLLELLLEVLHVVVLELELCGKAEATAVHDACMVAVIADNIVVAVNNLTDDATVHGETRRKAKRFFLAYELGKFLLELHMDVERTVKETTACTTAAVPLHSSTTSIDDALVAGQTCVSIRAEHQHTAAFHDDLRTLLAFYLAEIRVNTLRHELLWERIFGASIL